MAKGKSGYVEFMDGLSPIVKIIFALPGLDILWAIYRLVKGVERKNATLVVAGIIWIFAGWAILWIIDLVTTILSGRPTIFVD